MWLTDYVANRWKFFAEIITNQGPEPQPVVSVYYLYTCRYLRVLYNHMLITTTLPSDFLFKYQSDKDLKTTRTETHFTEPLKKNSLERNPLFVNPGIYQNSCYLILCLFMSFHRKSF